MPRSSCIRAARRLVAIVCVGGGRWRAGAEVATAAVAAASAATVVDLGVVVSDDCERGRPGPEFPPIVITSSRVSLSLSLASLSSFNLLFPLSHIA